MILTLQTSAFSSYGGISTYNRLVCRVLNDFNEAGGRKVLLGTDYPSDIQIQAAKLPNLKLEAFSNNRTSFVRRILSLAMDRRIDLALIGHVNYAPLGLLLSRLQPALRYGVIVHGVDVWSRLPAVRRRALHQADFIISVSEYTKQQAIEVNSAVASRFHLLPNTLQWKMEDGQAASAKSTGLKLPAGTRLLTVCRLDSSERYKGVDTVIKALPVIAAQVPDIQYLIIGSGDDIKRLKVLAGNVGVTERIHFLGSVNDAQLRAYYQACDVFVMPSAKEGFGIVFLEAMQYSKPVVAADKGGSPEVVLDGVTGLLVQYNNIPQLAESITRLCLNPELRIKLGQAGNQRLQEKFTFHQFKQTLTGILKQELPAAAIYRTHSRTLIEDLKAL
jgi:phosphatidylinositol alpha-1,6-mannosyltransferase